MGWKNCGREGQHMWGYVFGMATTVFHPHTHLVHLSIHFRRFNGKCGPGVLRHKN